MLKKVAVEIVQGRVPSLQQLSRPGLSHQVVSSSQGVRLFSWTCSLTQQMRSFLCMCPILGLMAWKHGSKMLFSITGMISMPLHFPLHCFKTNLSLILVAPLWPQKKQFADLPALLVAEPLELSLLWNLLVQPHQKVPQRSGDAATLLMEVVWRLFHKAGFSKLEAGESWLWTSKTPRNVSARESGLDSSIGIVKEISLWKATDLQKAAEGIGSCC